MVVQLNVKKAFDHVDHRAAFKAMRLQGVRPFSMALIAAIWNGSCMKARLGAVSSSKVRMSRGLPQGALAEVIAKLKGVGLNVGAQKTHWMSHPKMVDKSIMVDGLAVLWEEVLEFMGSKVCLDGNARHAIARRTAQANKCLEKWRPVLKSSWLPKSVALEHCKNHKLAGFSLEFERVDDSQGTKGTSFRVGVREWWQT